jgi:mRNA interferase MazF
MQNNYPKRGDVYWVRLDPTMGKEIKKARPCVIISCDSVNRSQDLIIVTPITSSITRLQDKVEVRTLVGNTPGKAVTLHTRSIDKKKRLGKKIGEFTKEEMDSIDAALRKILNL